MDFTDEELEAGNDWLEMEGENNGYDCTDGD